MSLPRPLRKQFKAGRVLPCVPKWLTLKVSYLHYFAARDIEIEDDLDYRYVEVNPGDEVLLVTPKGLETLDIKTELYTYGWRTLLENHPDFEVLTKDKLGLQRLLPGEDLSAPTLVLARSIKTGELRKSGLVYPRVSVVGQRDE